MYQGSGRSIQEVGTIQRVALLRNEAGIADDTPQFLFAGAMVRAGSRDHIFLNHDTADVVAAESQPELAGLEPLRHPAGLHVLEVVEIDPADGERLQVLDRRSLFLDEAAEGRVLALKSPRDKGG